MMLSTLLKDNGFGVLYENGDYYATNESFFEKVCKSASEAMCVCFTATTPQYNDVELLAKKIKSQHINVPILLGGPHITSLTHSQYTSGCFDYICRGYDIREALNTILSLERGTIYYPKVSKTYFDYKKDFTIVPSEFRRNTLWYSYITFGCPKNCKYCVEHTFSNTIVCGKIKEKIDEIVFLKNEMHVNVIHLADSDFFIKLDIVDEFLDELQNTGIKVCFSCNTSPSTIALKNVQERILRFKQLGLIEVMIGIEHCSNELISHYAKKYDIGEVEKALFLTKKEIKIPIVSLYTLVGLPFETQKDIEDNILKLTQWKKDGLFDFSFPKFFVPYPGTDVFNNPEKYRCKIVSYDWSMYHRWCLPRPIVIDGMSDDMFLDEIRKIDMLNI